MGKAEHSAADAASGADDIVITDEFARALETIDSGVHVFITGRAGTGKSTLLRLFRERLDDEVVVLAPTGVAALNVDGMTIHRFFGMRPGTTLDEVRSDAFTPRNVKTMKSLRRLVIDEVSMVRADMFDAIETLLRRFGPEPGTPFGGVQLVMFGDLYQLPPVTQGQEADYLRDTYTTDKFFSADCLQSGDFEIVELTEVFRQRDPAFVQVLNAIRDGSVTDADLAALNARFDPAFEPPSDDDFYVTLTTTNKRVDEINSWRLGWMDADSAFFRASVADGFPDGSDPTDRLLELKVGAQVMLLTNDAQGRWVNGTLGRVEEIPSDAEDYGVAVRLQHSNQVVRVLPHTWEHREAVYEEGRLRFREVGGFRQFPLRLAWAFTIHKSQGKTFDNVIIDLYRGTFSDGQLYVALSRCTSLDGIVLKTQVRPSHVKVDRGITTFLRRMSLTATSDGAAAARDVRRWASLAVIETSHGRGDRYLEFAAVVTDDDGHVHEYETVINPGIDVGDPRQHGITADIASAAPTFIDAWAFLREQLDGSVLATHGMTPLHASLEKALRRVGYDDDLGSGFCTLEMAGLGFGSSPSGASALEQARWVDSIRRNSVGDQHVQPFTMRGDGPEATPRLLARVADARRANLELARAPADPERMYALTVALAASSPLEDALNLPPAGGLEPDQIKTLNRAHMDSFLTVVTRDAHVSDRERRIATNLAGLLGVPVTHELDATSDTTEVADVLTPGARLCFTGTAFTAGGDKIDRDELENIAQAAGFLTVGTVSKTRCDVLVTADPSSMSRKAQSARAWGKPVISVQQFLDEIERQSD